MNSSVSLSNSLYSPPMVEKKSHPTLFSQGGVILLGLVLLIVVLTIGAFAICVAAGYSGVAYWYPTGNGHALIYCVA